MAWLFFFWSTSSLLELIQAPILASLRECAASGLGKWLRWPGSFRAQFGSGVAIRAISGAWLSVASSRQRRGIGERPREVAVVECPGTRGVVVLGRCEFGRRLVAEDGWRGRSSGGRSGYGRDGLEN